MLIKKCAEKSKTSFFYRKTNGIIDSFFWNDFISIVDSQFFVLATSAIINLLVIETSFSNIPDILSIVLSIVTLTVTICVPIFLLIAISYNWLEPKKNIVQTREDSLELQVVD